MFLCDDKYSSASRLGQLQELMSVGIPAMTLLSGMPLALHTLGVLGPDWNWAQQCWWEFCVPWEHPFALQPGDSLKNGNL